MNARTRLESDAAQYYHLIMMSQKLDTLPKKSTTGTTNGMLAAFTVQDD